MLRRQTDRPSEDPQEDENKSLVSVNQENSIDESLLVDGDSNEKFSLQFYPKTPKVKLR